MTIFPLIFAAIVAASLLALVALTVAALCDRRTRERQDE